VLNSSTFYDTNFLPIFFQQKTKIVRMKKLRSTLSYEKAARKILMNLTKGVPSRILIFSLCVTGALLFWSYSACLTSFLAAEKLTFPITSFSVSDLNHRTAQTKYKPNNTFH